MSAIKCNRCGDETDDAPGRICGRDLSEELGQEQGTTVCVGTYLAEFTKHTPEQVSAITDDEEIDGLVHQRDEAREQLATYKDLYNSAMTLLGQTRRERDTITTQGLAVIRELADLKAEGDALQLRADLASMTRDRDEARGEVQRLLAALATAGTE